MEKSRITVNFATIMIVIKTFCFQSLCACHPSRICRFIACLRAQFHSTESDTDRKQHSMVFSSHHRMHSDGSHTVHHIQDEKTVMEGSADRFCTIPLGKETMTYHPVRKGRVIVYSRKFAIIAEEYSCNEKIYRNRNTSEIRIF